MAMPVVSTGGWVQKGHLQCDGGHVAPSREVLRLWMKLKLPLSHGGVPSILRDTS